MRIFTAGISNNSKAPGKHSGSAKYEMYILPSDFTALSNPWNSSADGAKCR